jgi:sulfur-oxidizing protein SoxY
MIARARLLALLAGCTVLAVAGAATNDAPDPDTAIWAKVKRSLFADRPVQENRSDIVELIAPERAEDAAVVPIAIRTGLAQTRERYVKRLYLIVDNNPSPIAATLDLSVESGRADLETRIRVEQYSYVRAVAELSDGTLAADRRFVKASGGCSAAGRDAPDASAIGRMRLITQQPVLRNATRAELRIVHPNDSGLVMDQLTRLYTPAYFVRRLEVSYAGKPVLTAELDFSLSENPYLRFYFMASQDGELEAHAVDTRGLEYDARLAIRPRAP